MEVIVEQVLFDNLIIDYLILKLTNKILKLQVSKKKLFLGAVIGSMFALILPLFSFNGVLLYLIKMLIGFCMVLVLKKYKNVSELTVSFITMVSITFMFGGLCYAVTLNLENVVSMHSFVLDNFQFPIGIILLSILLYVWLFDKILNYIKKKTQVYNFSYDIEIQLKDKVFKFKAYLDSGNKLLDKDLKPIMLLSSSAFNTINKELNNINSKNNFNNFMKNIHFVEMQTAGGSNQIVVFDIEKLTIKKENEQRVINKDARVGIANTNFKNFDALLSLDMLN